MARDQLARVFDLHAALDGRLSEIAEGCRHREDHREQRDLPVDPDHDPDDADQG